jgi:acetyl esterase/lipase
VIASTPLSQPPPTQPTPTQPTPKQRPQTHAMLPSRRTVLGGLAGLGALVLAACGRGRGKKRTGSDGSTRHSYGSGPSQFGDLYLPAAGVTRQPGVVVVIHGGFWLSTYGLDLGAPLAHDLAARGWAAWNLEYRRVGNGGGWPATVQDVAAGVDALADLSGPNALDLSRVTVIGHSAGGQLGAWAAARAALPATAPGANPRVPVTAVVSQAGVLDLVAADKQDLGGGAVAKLMGGSPAAQPERYRWANPQQQIPLAVPVLCVHGRSDANVPISQSRDYVAAATKAGARATLTEVDGDHFTLIDTASGAWRAVIAALPALMA